MKQGPWVPYQDVLSIPVAGEAVQRQVDGVGPSRTGMIVSGSIVPDPAGPLQGDDGRQISEFKRRVL